MDSLWSRRRLLIATTGTFAALSGCSSPATKASNPFQLGSIEIRNLSADSHRVHLFVKHNSEVVYWRDVIVEGKQGDTLGGAVISSESLVPTEGDVVIHARIDEQARSATFDSSDENLTGCHVVMVRIEDEGTVGFAASGDAYECET